MTLLVAALFSFAFVLVLGAYARRAPIGIDANVAVAAFGKATNVAWAFTNLGYARDLLIVYAVAGVLLQIERPRDIAPLAVLAVAQVGSQLVSTSLKGVFKRERPENWLKRQELSAGYPSGHSTTAVVTYVGIGLGALAPIDSSIAIVLRDCVGAIAIVAALGIVWSRLALGAHYLSDVVGGCTLGAATLCVAARILER